jgi:hypothetical protein
LPAHYLFGVVYENGWRFLANWLASTSDLLGKMVGVLPKFAWHFGWRVGGGASTVCRPNKFKGVFETISEFP